MLWKWYWRLSAWRLQTTERLRALRYIAHLQMSPEASLPPRLAHQVTHALHLHEMNPQLSMQLTAEYTALPKLAKLSHFLSHRFSYIYMIVLEGARPLRVRLSASQMKSVPDWCVVRGSCGTCTTRMPPVSTSRSSFTSGLCLSSRCLLLCLTLLPDSPLLPTFPPARLCDDCS